MSEAQIDSMTVVEVCPLTADILKLKIRPAEPFEYSAGQYVMLGLEEENLKPFSIANAPNADGLLEFHVRRQADNDWMEAFFNIKVFDTVYVEGPKDQFSLDKLDKDHQRDIILVAGGTGFAPMKALLEALLAQDDSDNEPPLIEFYWGARHAVDLYEHDDMLALCRQYPQLNYIPVVSEEDNFRGRKGLVHQIVLENHPDLSRFRVFVCGPWPMQEAAKQDFLAAGLPAERFN